MLAESNGFHFYYNNNKDQKFRSSIDDTWMVEYPASSLPEKDFINECVDAAKKIASIKKPLLLFSGGIDSEVMVRSFYEAKVDFDICIGSYQGLNYHDIEYAFSCCEELKISPIIIDIDLEKFWREELDSFANISQTFSPQLCTYMKISSYFNDHLVVLGGGENHLIKENGEWFLSEKERISSLHRYFINSNICGWGGFFQYTPGLIRSSLKSMIEFTLDESQDSKDFKFNFYNKHWSIKSRPKYTGFEKVQDLDHLHRTKLKENPLFGDQRVLTNIKDFLNE